MKNKRRAALDEKIGKIAGDYRTVALQIPLRGRNSAGNITEILVYAFICIILAGALVYMGFIYASLFA